VTQNVQGAGGDARVTALLVATAVVSAIAGFLYGYDTGIISGALLQIADEFKIGHGWQQVIAAGILVGAVIGALVGAPLRAVRPRAHHPDHLGGVRSRNHRL
jgi:MFS family permease